MLLNQPSHRESLKPTDFTDLNVWLKGVIVKEKLDAYNS